MEVKQGKYDDWVRGVGNGNQVENQTTPEQIPSPKPLRLEAPHYGVYRVLWEYDLTESDSSRALFDAIVAASASILAERDILPYLIEYQTAKDWLCRVWMEDRAAGVTLCVAVLVEDNGNKTAWSLFKEVSTAVERAVAENDPGVVSERYAITENNRRVMLEEEATGLRAASLTAGQAGVLWLPPDFPVGYSTSNQDT